MVTKPPPRWSTPASSAKSQVPQQTLINRLRCSGWASSSPARHSVTTLVVAQAEATDALPIPDGKVQLLIVPGSLMISTHRHRPPGAQGMSPHSMVNSTGIMPPRSPA